MPSDVFGDDVFAVRMKYCYRYGKRKLLRTDVRFKNRSTGRTYSLTPTLGKQRVWLRVKIAGKLWHVGRLVAWCFGNPRALKWETFAQRCGNVYKYQALHLSLDETDFSAGNLQVGTRKQNLEQYRSEAASKYGRMKRD